MKAIRFLCLFATGLAGTLLPAQSTQPLVTPQGTFTLIDYPDAASTQIWAVNGRGEMVGVYTGADRTTHGFLYSRGRFKSIDYPGAAITLANNINAQGDIVGEYAMTATGPRRGFLLSGGRYTTIEYPGTSASGVVGIAANGDLAGYFDNPLRGYMLSGDQFTPIDVPDGSPTVVGGMGPQGDVIGGYVVGGVGRAFRFRNGEFTTWEYPGANGFTNAVGMNAAGDIVGRYRDAAGVSQGYVLSRGEFTSFGCPGATFTGAAGITPDGDIVGRCTIGGVSHGFVLKRGQQPRYTVIDLGTLGGHTSYAYGISNSGAVSGSAAVANGDEHPFLWRDGRMTDLGGLGGGNGAGQNPTGGLRIPVTSETSRPDPFGADFCGWGTHRICLAAIWRDGSMTALPTLGGNNAIGFSMNERGQMVGVSEKASPDPKCPTPQKLSYAPVMWGPSATDIRELRLPSGDSVGWAYGLNEKGEAVGATGSCANTSAPAANGELLGARAVLWENTIPRDLGNLGGDFAVAVGVNNRTEVVGSASVATGELHGFVWSRDHGMEDIGAIGEDALGAPSSINNSRQITGASCDAEFNCRAFLWERYNMADLNDLAPEDSPIYMVFATWINDVGEIVGWGIDKRTEEVRAFLAKPSQPAASAGPKSASAARTLPVRVRTQLQRQLRSSQTKPAGSAIR
jgi:probable HAF family extracellular repeat protein